jgi:hypothetical protein
MSGANVAHTTSLPNRRPDGDVWSAWFLDATGTSDGHELDRMVVRFKLSTGTTDLYVMQSRETSGIFVMPYDRNERDWGILTRFQDVDRIAPWCEEYGFGQPQWDESFTPRPLGECLRAQGRTE